MSYRLTRHPNDPLFGALIIAPSASFISVVCMEPPAPKELGSRELGERAMERKRADNCLEKEVGDRHTHSLSLSLSQKLKEAK